MRYEWDEAKNRSNIEKHGLDFTDAPLVLNGRCVTFVDDRFEYGEKRLVSLGTLAGRVVVIAHAPRTADVTRIISMRKANRREQKAYYQERPEAT
jgi:uncharacterized protein